MTRIEDYLQRHAQQSPDRLAVRCGAESYTYGRLWDCVRRKASELESSAARIVPFRASQDAGFLITYFAIHLAGKVAMPLEHDMPQGQFDDLCRMAACARVADDAADVLFTTGSVGRPKGVVVSHGAIMADAHNLIEAQGYHAGLTFLISGPLSHIGSLSKVYPVIVTGGALVILNGMKDLNAFFGAVDSATGTVGTFLVPASIRMLLAFAAQRLSACNGKIEMIETGAAPISLSDMRALCAALPSARLYNTYASTETGIVATHNFNGSGDCIAGCVGHAMRHSSISIDSSGCVACGGHTLMSGYLCDPERTASVLRGNMLHTADLGHFDSDGRLRIDGRADDMINVGGYKVDPADVENSAMALPAVADCICVRSSHRVLGTVLRLLVVVNSGYGFDARSLATALKRVLPAYKVPAQYERVDRIECTRNGKPNRRYYDGLAAEPGDGGHK